MTVCKSYLKDDSMMSYAYIMTVWLVLLKNDDNVVSYTKEWWQNGELY